MKVLAIVLIIVLLGIPIISYSYGYIASVDGIIFFEEDEPENLDKWFADLPLIEKIGIYIYWQKRLEGCKDEEKE